MKSMEPDTRIEQILPYSGHSSGCIRAWFLMKIDRASKKGSTPEIISHGQNRRR
jgi:hypothetical protein